MVLNSLYVVSKTGNICFPFSTLTQFIIAFFHVKYSFPLEFYKQFRKLYMLAATTTKLENKLLFLVSYISLKYH